MRSIYKGLVNTLFLLMIVNTAIAQELRIGLDYDKKVSENLKFIFKGQIRNNLQYENSTYYIIQPGISFDLTKRFTLSGAYRFTSGYNYTVEDDIDMINLHKNRITLDGKYKFRQLSDRFCLDYRLRYQYTYEKGKSKKYIRNRMKLKYSNSKHSNISFGVEPYYRLDTKELSQLRISISNSYNFEAFELEVYMLLDGSFNNGSLKSMHQIGVSFAL